MFHHVCSEIHHSSSFCLSYPFISLADPPMDGHCRSGDFRRLAGGNSRGAATGMDQEALGEIHWSFWRGNSEIQNSGIITLLWINISPPKVCLQMIFLIPFGGIWDHSLQRVHWMVGRWSRLLGQRPISGGYLVFLVNCIQRSLNSTHFLGWLNFMLYLWSFWGISPLFMISVGNIMTPVTKWWFQKCFDMQLFSSPLGRWSKFDSYVVHCALLLHKCPIIGEAGGRGSAQGIVLD